VSGLELLEWSRQQHAVLIDSQKPYEEKEALQIREQFLTQYHLFFSTYQISNFPSHFLKAFINHQAGMSKNNVGELI
jgi:predicted secreted protein